YLRNRIRSTLLPVLHECDSRFDVNFLKTLNKLKKSEQFIKDEADKAFKQITLKKNGTTIINTRQLQMINSVLHPYIIIQWLIEHKVPFTATQTFLDEIVRFVLSPRGGNHAIHTSWSLVKKYNKVHIHKQSRN